MIKKRGNGQGTAIKVATNNWKAIATIGYTEDGKAVKRTKQGFKTKTEALAYIPTLKKEKAVQNDITLHMAYDRWLESYKDKVGKSTLNCYISGFKVYEYYWHYKLRSLDIDDMQDCIEDCEHGYRTKQNAKTVLGLIFKWAIPRGYADINLSEYIKVNAEKTEKHGFTEEQLKIIAKNCNFLKFCDIVYCHCLTGFRPNELLELKVKDFDPIMNTLVGGSKTEAGKNRTVTLSPKILPIIRDFCDQKGEEAYIFSYDGKKLGYKKYKEEFYTLLDRLGIQDKNDHTLSPHSCRHTFATLIKNINAPDVDKMKLIGHSSAEMLRYYQDSSVRDLQKITDLL